ncbi:MAG: glycosyltransferase family 4 protein [Firmicutes bacterium]|nr:glycosyltransferase family 4 protein [Bacillota bacterium]
MRVAMLHWAFPPMIGGVETHLAMLGPGLVERGVGVDLLTCPAEGCPAREEYRGVRVSRTPLMNLNELPPGRLEKEAGAVKDTIAEFIRESDPDLVHAHNFHYFSPVHARALSEAAEEAGTPVILTAHNAWDDELAAGLNKMAHRWDGVIAVSRFIEKELAGAGYVANRIRVVHHGIDTRRFTPGLGRDRFAGRRVIFHPARMCHDKGTHVAVEALGMIREEYPDVLLVMAGTGQMVDWRHLRDGYMKIITRRIKELHLQDNVHVEFYPWQEMPGAYREAEICIYPSCFQEPFGLALLEANASGRPMVVSRAGGMPEIIRDGVSGFLVDMHDHRQLARRCLDLLADPALSARMGEAGISMVEERFGVNAMVENTLAFYREVTG